MIIAVGIGGYFWFNNSEPAFNQKVSILNNSQDGKIVKKEKIDIPGFIKENFASKAPEGEIERIKNLEFYYIEYKSENENMGAYMIKPKKDGDYPVFIYNRYGKQKRRRKRTELTWLSGFSSQNYVLISPQYKGEYKEGQEDFVCNDINEIMDFSPLIKSLPFTDANNIVMAGRSRGGSLTYQAVKNNFPLQAAVVIGAPTDLIQLYNKGSHGQKEFLEEKLGGAPENNKAKYKVKSPYYWVDKIDVPILIMHGGQDWQINPSHPKKLYSKLEKLNQVDHKLKIFPEGNHMLDNKQEINNKKIDLMFKWFQNYSDIKK